MMLEIKGLRSRVMHSSLNHTLRHSHIHTTRLRCSVVISFSLHRYLRSSKVMLTFQALNCTVELRVTESGSNVLQLLSPG